VTVERKQGRVKSFGQSKRFQAVDLSFGDSPTDYWIVIRLEQIFQRPQEFASY
jgi:hypothetical protein